MKKILFVILGIDFSGAEKVLLDYLRSGTEIEPLFLTVFPGKVKEFLKKENRGEVFSCDLKFNRLIFNLFPNFYSNKLNRCIAKIVQAQKIDVVYFNNTHEVMLAYKFLKEKRGNCLCVGHIHDMKSSIRSFIKRIYIRASLKMLKESITVSHACQESWKNINHVVYNGIEPDISRNNLQQVKRIGFIGNLSKRKGFDIYQKVAQQSDSTFEFSAVLKSDYEIKKNIRIYYNLSGSQVDEYLNVIDCLIVCSRHDPLPTVILEAFAHGVICVGNAIDGIPEMVVDDNLLATKNTPREYIRILKYINTLSSIDLEKIINKQYNVVLNQFSMNKKVERINHLLEEL